MSKKDDVYKVFDVDPERTKQLLPFLLSTMDDKVLEAVILGTMGQLYCTDREAMRTVGVRTDAGIYFNSFYSTGSVPSSLSDRGKGFSVKEYEGLIKVMAERMDDE